MMKLYVGNLPFDATEEGIIDLFTAYGSVDSVNIITDRETGRPRGFSFVEMPNDAEAKNAIENLHGADFGGRSLNVNQARTRVDRPTRGGW